MTNNNVWVVVPNWNGAEFIRECLSSLNEQSYRASVVVVDNGSVDDSVKIIEREFPDAHLIKLPRNRGFAGGVNAGINFALEKKADAIALFNNDATADKNWLKNLVGALNQDTQIGIATGKFMRQDKKHIDSAGEEYSIWGMPFPRGRNQLDMGQFDRPEPVFAATGGASLYRARMLKQIGLFDEKFFAYLEDVDISFRARLRGWDVWYQPSAMAYHRVGGTSSKLGSFMRYHTIKNFFLLYTKNMPAPLYLKYGLLFNLYALRLLLSSALKGGLLSYVKALFKFFLYLPAVLIERRQIQKGRPVSFKQIDGLLYRRRPPKIPDF